jgi:hypothetical protein
MNAPKASFAVALFGPPYFKPVEATSVSTPYAASQVRFAAGVNPETTYCASTVRNVVAASRSVEQTRRRDPAPHRRALEHAEQDLRERRRTVQRSLQANEHPASGRHGERQPQVGRVQRRHRKSCGGGFGDRHCRVIGSSRE